MYIARQTLKVCKEGTTESLCQWRMHFIKGDDPMAILGTAILNDNRAQPPNNSLL